MNGYTYSQRKNFWDAVGKFHHMGYTTDLAIVWVYKVYWSRKTVTAILDAIITDKQAHMRGFNALVFYFYMGMGGIHLLRILLFLCLLLKNQQEC